MGWGIWDSRVLALVLLDGGSANFAAAAVLDLVLLAGASGMYIIVDRRRLLVDCCLATGSVAVVGGATRGVVVVGL